VDSSLTQKTEITAFVLELAPESLAMATSVNYYGHGKLLITGEYAVLDGATALAVPTRLGQRLRVTEKESSKLRWESYDVRGKLWFKARFKLNSNDRWVVRKTSDKKIAERLEKILRAADRIGADVGEELEGVTVRTELEFPRKWGLGTSSTLIHCLARWWQIDPYRLLDKTFGGSGYDLACAAADGPICYRRTPDGPAVETTVWRPAYRDRLAFVYLGKKQNSREGIRRYRERPKDLAWIDEITSLTEAFLGVDDLSEAQHLLRRHERTVASHLELPTVQSTLFADFPGVVKSLGAWGGDFVLALSNVDYAATRAYFRSRGYATVLRYEDLFA
jgi:mevalonate kinase